MHERGVVHRDLKAENLLIVDPTAKYPTVKLIDFGFSTILRHNLTGSFLGMSLFHCLFSFSSLSLLVQHHDGVDGFSFTCLVCTLHTHAQVPEVT